MTLPELTDMPQITVAELLADFDACLDRVAAGACYLIIDAGRPSCVLMPYCEEIAVYFDGNVA